MSRIVLIVIYVVLCAISAYLPSVEINDSKVFVFALICVCLLKEFDWYLLKKSCKNSKDLVCKMFRKKNNDKQSIDP